MADNSEKTFKVNVDWMDAKQSFDGLITSMDRLSKKMDEFGQRTTRGMNTAAAGTRKTKQATVEYNSELAKTERLIAAMQAKKRQLSMEEKGQLESLLQRQRRLRAEMQKTGQQGVAATEKVTKAQSRLNNQVSLGRQLYLRLKSVMLTVFGAYAIINGIRNTINTIKDFELGVARLRAITGKTKEEIQGLADLSKVLGERGIFSASEITEVQVQLAKFGFTIKEIAASTEGIIDLATATGEDLNSAATLVSSSLRALGLEAEETGRLVDVLGKSFTSSALDVEKFRESAKYVLPLARQMGWSIEEVAATLGKLADSGISGSLAGTGLRQTFINLWDASSGLSNILGRGIKTFDQFFDAIQRVKDEGVAFDTVLAEVPVRAKTMFTVLWNGAQDIKEFAKEMDKASGSIENMANIQMDTLAFQMERFNNAWKTFVLSIQSNGGWLTDFFRGVSMYLNEWSYALDPEGREKYFAQKRVDDFMTRMRESDSGVTKDAIRNQIDEVTKTIEGELNKIDDKILKSRKDPILSLTEWVLGRDFEKETTEEVQAAVAGFRHELKLLNEELYGKQISDAVSSYTYEIEKLATKLVSEGVPAIEAFDEGFREQEQIIKNLRDLNPKVYDDILKGVKDYYAKHRAILIENKLLEDQINKEILDNYIKNQQKLLGYLEQNMIMRAKRIDDEQAREEQLLGIQKFFAIKRLELLIQSGDLTKDQEAAVREQILEIEKTFQYELMQTRREFHDKRTEEEEKQYNEFLSRVRARNSELESLQKERDKNELQQMKIDGKSEEEIWKRNIELQIQAKEREIEFAQRAGDAATQVEILKEQLKGLRLELEAGFGGKSNEDPFNLKDLVSALKQSGREIMNSLQEIADAEVDLTTRFVDNLNTRISEIQREMEVEAELYAAGYANNLSIKRKEYEDLKAVREKALRDQEEAIRKQQRLEAIAQAVNLGSAVAQTINMYSKIPAVGPVLAAAAVAAFLGLFFSSQKKIQAATKYGEGGEVDGKLHSQGGTLIEAEKGEYVIKRKQYSKYAELVKAINEDTLPKFNSTVINSLGGKQGDVVVSTKEWGEIRDLLRDNLAREHTEIVGNKKITISGIRKRITNV